MPAKPMTSTHVGLAFIIGGVVGYMVGKRR
jgi:hypothetical protein